MKLNVYCFIKDFKLKFSSLDFILADSENDICQSSLDINSVFNMYLSKFKLKDEDNINIYCNFSSIIDKDERLTLASLIFKSLDNYPDINKENFSIQYYLFTQDGNEYAINDFEKIISNLSYLSSNIDENMLKSIDQYSDKLKELEDKSMKIKLDSITDINEYNSAMSLIIESSYLSFNLSRIMNENIDNNKDEFEKEMVNDIVEYRKEEEGSEIKTELDLVNKVLLDNGLNSANSTPGKCIYNDKEISMDELVSKLYSHTFPNYITQVDIRTTLDDEYKIDFGDKYLVREKGGQIKIIDKED